MRPPTKPPASRVILLGASNVSLEMSTAVRLIGRFLPGPIDYHIADGFGRSYGQPSSILWRVLPGITECDLWSDVNALHENNSRPSYALITDIGNDIAYGADPIEIAQWVENCIERLQKWGVRIVMSALPTESLLRLSPWYLGGVRRILFPSCRLTPAEIIRRVRDLDEMMLSIGIRHGIPQVPVEVSWYGLDPVHVRRKYWFTFWQRVIAEWLNDDNSQVISSQVNDEKWRADPLLWCYLWTRWAKRRRVLGNMHRRLQPSGRLTDGSTISVY